ncbi:MAG TPA: hypothetical protein VLF61_03400 [Rhabdochlamydiaceae bacterium]|nr:hypothetical protein [Rhabdochlamydiaceae bacterium]
MSRQKLEELSPVGEVGPYNSFLPPPSLSKTAADLIPISSIGKKAASKELPPIPSKPIVDGPPLLRLTIRLETEMNQRQKNIQEFQAQYFERDREYGKELMLKIKESAAKAEDSTHWKYLQDIGALLISAINTVLGFTLLSSTSSTFLGGALVASGILSMANFVFIHTDVWDDLARKMAGADEELQKKIKSLLPAAISLASTLLALGGTGAAFYHSLGPAQKFFAIARTASNLLQGSFAIGTGVYEMRAKQIELAIDAIKIETEHGKYQMKSSLDLMEEFYIFIGKFIEDTSFSVNTTLNANLNIIQG